MAVTSTFTRSTATLKFETGETTASGNTKIVSVNLGSLDPSALGDDEGKQKAYNIATALVAVMLYDFSDLLATTTMSIDGE